MMIIKNISRIIAISLILVGFISGSFISVIESSCCCGTADSCCCCTDESTETESTSLDGICSCEIEKTDPPVALNLEANNNTRPEYKIVKTEPLPRCISTLASSDQAISISIESVRNSGPPIFISVSSLLI